MNRTATLSPVETQPEPLELRRVLDAFGTVAGAIAVGADRDEVLRLLADQSCALIGVRRSSIYLRDPRTGVFEGRIAAGDPRVDAEIRRTRAGIEADSLTQEILMTKRPVLIRDARSDVRPVRAAMRRWGITRILGVPMLREGEVVGLIFLDNEDVPHDYTEQEQALCLEFATFAAALLFQIDQTMDLRARARASQLRSETLLRAAAAEDRLARLVGPDTDLGELLAVLAEVSGMACSIRDRAFRQLAVALPPEAEGEGQLSERLRDLEEPPLAAREPLDGPGRGQLGSFLAPMGGSGPPHRMLVTPVTVGGRPWGSLTLVKLQGRPGRLDAILARRSVTLIGLQIGIERRALGADSQAADSFFRDLLQRTDQPGSLERRALGHGFAIDRPHAVCLLSPEDLSDRELLSPARLGEALGELRATLTTVDEGTVALIELPEASEAAVRAARAELERVVVELAPDGVAGAISTPCTRAVDYAPAYRQARHLSRSLLTLRSSKSSRIEASTEVGAAVLLLADTDKRDAERFVLDTFGALLEGTSAASGEGGDSLLLTLNTFFDCSRSVRNSAVKLGVHENTIRNRLARIAEITGLDIAGNATDQLSAQAALLVMRLQGRL